MIAEHAETMELSRRLPTQTGSQVVTRLLGLALCSSILLVVVFCSLAFGAKPIPLSTVFDAMVHYDSTSERPPDHPLAADPAHDRRAARRRRPRPRRRRDAGRRPQPARRPGHPRGQRRRSAVRRDRHLQLRRRRRCSATCGSPSSARPSRRSSSTCSGRSGRDGATPVKLALAGAAITAFLGSITTAILLIDRGDARPVPVLGRRLARRPVVDTIAWQVAPVHRRRHASSRSPAGRILNALALGDDVARSLGQKVGAGPAVVRRSRSCCSSARRRPRRARSRSSA